LTSGPEPILYERAHKKRPDVRITQEAKAATRERVLDAARRMFARAGFEAATTRDIAREAGIAAGTLFNYFPNKDAVALALIADALAAGRSDFEQRRRPAALAEDLFAHVAAGLRRLKPFRRFLRPVLETAFSPALAPGADAGASLRADHLETVGTLLVEHGCDPAPLGLQLYWTLYTGVLGFWAADRSPKQEDTLALLDQSISMFVAWLLGGAQPTDADSDRSGAEGNSRVQPGTRQVEHNDEQEISICESS
jgi:AcrR family transcriptional regulator